MTDTAKDVRARLIDALHLDLVGPKVGHDAHDAYAEELLPIAPSKWYLTGFLIPNEAPINQRGDDDADEQPDQIGHVRQTDDENVPEQASARKAYFPSSMGLSVLVPAQTTQLTVKVEWADYVPLGRDGRPIGAEAAEDVEVDESEMPTEREGRGKWQRVPREAERVITLKEGSQNAVGLPGFEGLQIVVSVRPVNGHNVRSVSVFFVNSRKPAPDIRRDAAYVFQPELSLHSEEPFHPRPDLHGQDSNDQDEQVAALQYRDVFEFAVGHNVSAIAERDGANSCRDVRTSWMPVAEVEKVVARTLGSDVELGMEALANAESPQAIVSAVGPMLTAYAAWIRTQAETKLDETTEKGTADRLLKNASRTQARLQAGLDALSNPLVFEAFRLANRAIATAIRQRACHNKPEVTPDQVDPPRWRPFQLAFLLMNVPGTAEPAHEDRKLVDLLFFPTGGGKTEAYLGLAAFAMFLRRLKDPSVQSSGVSVLMRYTLRLLTLDQLGRAATLVCAMELLRQADVEKLGSWPFEIGLWVGQSATPNRMGTAETPDKHSARARTLAFQHDPGRKSSPIPLENCPWCGWSFSKDSFKLLPDAGHPTDLRVMCVHRKCEFHGRKQARGIPILAVDDPIFRRLPAFIISTVDKFANLPWVGDTAGLFGRVDRYDAEGFYGPTERGLGHSLAKRLPPPDLIIQDELHLISGPLGTMVGLYETAIDALSTAGEVGEGPGPKIVASTATVRRAERQIQALFGRSGVEVFPPPGPDRRDSFFAVTVSPAVKNPRSYVGIAAQGRNVKVVLLRTYVALMAAAQKAWLDHGGAKNSDNPADPYMTLLGYFNSLRELGGSRRIVEDEVSTRLSDIAERRTRVGETTCPFANRPKVTEPRELTSRVSTNEVAKTKQQLALSFSTAEHVDVALATNMISVGLDITRLGLMVVFGQPKTASEYIQATSRVGRDDEKPGLVVTLLNVYRPRDRSHYERFATWHESFYRSVEATSVTPFSPRAIDRGIAGVAVALARLGHSGMTAPRDAVQINKHKSALGYVAEVISRRAEHHDTQLGSEAAEALRKRVKDRVEGLLDAWSNIATKKGEMQYQREVGGAPPLLFDPLDPELEKQSREAQQFKAGRSLRDVEPTVNLWLKNPEGGEVEEETE